MREHLSRIGLILVGIGSAIGLGNIWRFPYVVGTSGGGAFLIPYLIAVILFGLPVIMIELAAGRKFQGSVVTTFRKIKSSLGPLGILPVLICLGILSYYLVIMGWVLAFVYFSFVGYPSFDSFTLSNLPFLFFLICLFAVFLVDRQGIKKGIEKICRLMMPLLFVFLLFLMGKALLLPGARAGLLFYLKPDLSALSDPKVWALAFGQAFFSMSAGWGIMMTFGSYMRKKDSIITSSLWIAGADTLVALLAGFIIFPIVFSFGMDPAAGPQLAFVTLPAIFSAMPLGHFLGGLFFTLLFIGGFTSAVSIIEVCTTVFVDESKIDRRKASAFAVILTLFLGIPSVLSYGVSSLLVWHALP
ncbi:sodium-dependent transporter [Candidatus Woesearchaeota archaeon]|nr:MAG: neurotransmitter:Na+ symporter, NSS family [archaeon GW2011_AR4]MBS3130341.1 sodium-dependent transporter [Candidatus Woesearchaeota archaeon]HIH38938.1 sodium-dependent transporter [Candidatus Woesearchaeota archaeon]HIH48055.1 sodium-dependent transporter [Candidatus Woesearchaeota archaeon]HIJ03398.1 sodium-dependent transporter [Candidatus Woesearchaeota archaeon]